MQPSIVIAVDAAVGILTLNRPSRHNALDRATIAEMTVALRELENDERVRAVVISSTGKNFCSGTDIATLRQILQSPEEENRHGEEAAAQLLATLGNLAKPTIARVQGPANGLGVGLIAACDIAVATYDASFALSEVRNGLPPAIVAPYLLAAIGERHSRYYMLTAERFSATEAYRIGLVNEMVPGEEQLDEAIGEIVDHLLKNGAQAMRAGKELIRLVAGQPIDQTTIDLSIQYAARAQSSEEGREGIAALVERRRPRWVE